jgi:hypothetical protein
MSGGFILGTVRWRYDIFQSELLLVLEAFRYGARTFFQHNPELDNATVQICFQSNNKRFNKIENWGLMSKYK